jgi:putative transcriptional regulator
MIRCHLSTLMGRDKVRISDVARKTGLNRSTISALYRETATRLDLEAVDRLCKLFRCSVGELLEHVEASSGAFRTRARRQAKVNDNARR